MPPIFSREIDRRVVTSNRLKFQNRTSPCESACPAGNLVQKVQALIKENDFERALEYLRTRNPFPGVTGRICNHPCETDCNRSKYDEAINIRGLERAAADFADLTRIKKPERMDRTGKRIAVIGGGPAGLTFAYFSSLFGSEVTVFEAAPVLGGTPRLSVPDYRLPKDLVDMEIGLILETGVKARTNTEVGRDISFEEIRSSFDAVLIATGTWKERKLDLPDGDKALKAVEFLRQVNLGQVREIGQRVVIMGGGGVSFDCAFTARRLGASEVHVVCLEERGSMCATPEDISQAREEGITIHNGCMASRVLERNGQITGMEFFGVSCFSFDEAGKARIQALSGDKRSLKADTVILAVGVQPELDFIRGSGIDLNPNGTISLDPRTRATSIEGVFACGDVTAGPSMVARAVGQGRETAIAVNCFLNGAPKNNEALVIGDDSRMRLDPFALETPPHVVAFEEMFNIDYYQKEPRRQTHFSTRISLRERDKGFDRSTAVLESGRCFHCGHCHLCGKCVEDCPGLILMMTEKGPTVVYPDECWHCGNCRISCPVAAVSYQFPIYTMV